jgi:nucleotidyltransferase substrate binding protein (TIGR01987 family)
MMLEALDQALESFIRLVAADMAALSKVLDEVLIDGLQNGKAQKFEYTLELCWKAIKVFLRQCEGIDEVSPKKIVKAFYVSGYLIEDDYVALIQAIDDRNKLSHFYNQAEFEQVLSRLPAYAGVMKHVALILRKGCIDAQQFGAGEAEYK